MKYITTAQLAAYTPPVTEMRAQLDKRARYNAFANAKPSNSIFLSHSHKDRELVLSTKHFLEAQGIDVYVDWLDDGMPEETSAETAMLIKDKIGINKKFAVIVTENSKASKWVPWELGFADKSKTLDHVLIVPVSETEREFTGVEYMRIYYSLEFYNNKWIAWRADPASIVELTDWIRR